MTRIDSAEPPVRSSQSRNSTRRPWGRSTQASVYRRFPEAQARATATYPPSSALRGVVMNRARRAIETSIAPMTGRVGK